MKLTTEQENIINSKGNIKINAVAGSGKTTTLIEYAKSRPQNAKILYLAFNKTVKLEALNKFSQTGLKQLTVETAHSLAYKYIMSGKGYKLRTQDYKPHEIAQLLKLKIMGGKHEQYILANHISQFVTYFCNSNKPKVKDLNYREVVIDPKAQKFVETHYSEIEKQSRLFLYKMDTGAIEIIHDFYLKKFQLTNPELSYDYILFDEGQDASPAMLDIFLKQKATKVIVGDTHQQIYSWRYAINPLEQTHFKAFQLSTSFRFSQQVASLAMEILKWKNQIQEQPALQISGKGNNKATKTKTVLARTNLGLLLKAIEYVVEKKKLKRSILKEI